MTGRGTSPLRAVVFDCDGTLVDTEVVTRRALDLALADVGVTATDELHREIVGRTTPSTLAHLGTTFGLGSEDLAAVDAAAKAYLDPLLDDPGLVFADTVALLDDLAADGVPVAVCTSSSRRHLDRMRALPPLRGRFVVGVAREDVPQHKPSPQPYARAIALLRTGLPDLTTDEVSVVEDSEVGVAAGRAAGCWTVAVDRGTGLHDLGAADVVTSHLRRTDLRAGPAAAAGS